MPPIPSFFHFRLEARLLAQPNHILLDSAEEEAWIEILLPIASTSSIIGNPLFVVLFDDSSPV